MKSRRTVAVVLSALFAVASLFAQTWTNTGPGGVAPSIACSADGTKLVAVGFPGPAYTSTNSGASWITNTGGYITAVAASADGNTFVICSNLIVIYVSTNAGLNWTSNSAFAAPGVSSLAMSADGTRVVAAGAGKFAMTSGHIYTSTNTGATWTQTAAPLDTWTSVACSADGNKIVAVSQDGRIETSMNFGLNWATNDSFAPRMLQWASVASSASGDHLVAAAIAESAAFGAVYTSSDSGVSWTSNNVPRAEWWSVASSADGEKLVADYQNGTYIYTSGDGGFTWSSNSIPGISTWTCASSADGGALAVGAASGIWTYRTNSPPHLTVKPSGGNLDLSWIIPSTNFVLQQSLNLASWQTLTNAPMLNFTNLEDEVFLVPSNHSAFFRLSSP